MEECPICYEELNDKNIETLLCDHKFHYDCILNVYKNPVIKREIRICPFCRGNGGYLSNVNHEIPIKGIHKNYNIFMDYIKTNNDKCKEFFVKGRCIAILKTGENKGAQCHSKNKQHSDFCGKHKKIL